MRKSTNNAIKIVNIGLFYSYISLKLLNIGYKSVKYTVVAFIFCIF